MWRRPTFAWERSMDPAGDGRYRSESVSRSVGIGRGTHALCRPRTWFCDKSTGCCPREAHSSYLNLRPAISNSGQLPRPTPESTQDFTLTQTPPPAIAGRRGATVTVQAARREVKTRVRYLCPAGICSPVRVAGRLGSRHGSASGPVHAHRSGPIHRALGSRIAGAPCLPACATTPRSSSPWSRSTSPRAHAHAPNGAAR
mmetsp:Transcript_3845/g.12848  ORF Transcript_3845/g.12848 Transcript_3845/m.12848 type:complete len:200 (+) Transcript_3845:422-1021(+)